MELDERGDPSDVIDRRGAGGRRGGLGLPMGRVGGGVGGVGILGVVIVVLVQMCSGGGFNLGAMSGLDELPGFPSGSGGLPTNGNPLDLGAPVTSPDPAENELAALAGAVISDANDTWEDRFARAGDDYSRTRLVLFTGGVDTACGSATSDVGPFYCPADSYVYIDLGFFDELARRFGAPGDFAQAYVIAHEVGHHVQNELGIFAEVQRLQRQDPDAANDLSVRTELQADCLAGVWGHTVLSEGRLEAGDIDEAIDAATAVGDDTIQSSMRGGVDPDSFTHGSAEQRRTWFRRGFDTGDAQECDTFSVESP